MTYHRVNPFPPVCSDEHIATIGLYNPNDYSIIATWPKSTVYIGNAQYELEAIEQRIAPRTDRQIKVYGRIVKGKPTDAGSDWPFVMTWITIENKNTMEKARSEKRMKIAATAGTMPAFHASAIDFNIGEIEEVFYVNMVDPTSGKEVFMGTLSEAPYLYDREVSRSPAFGAQLAYVFLKRHSIQLQAMRKAYQVHAYFPVTSIDYENGETQLLEGQAGSDATQWTLQLGWQMQLLKHLPVQARTRRRRLGRKNEDTKPIYGI